MNTVLFRGERIVPSKVVCVGRNYVEHVRELGNEVADDMVIFMKPNSAISDVLRAGRDEARHYETEICFLVKDQQWRGVGLGIDLTKRTLQTALKAKGLPWERSKAFDGSAVFSEFVSWEGETSGLRLSLEIDGKRVQEGDVTQMIYPPERIREELKHFVTLAEGDIVMTGTPKGVGVIEAGARFEAVLSCDGVELVSHRWLAEEGF